MVSTVILRSYKNTFRAQKTNKHFIQQFVSSTSPYSTILESITYINNVCCSESAALYADTLFALWSERKQRIRVHTLHMFFYVCDTLQNGIIGWSGGYKWLNKVIIFVFYVHKKYSRSFINLWLNHWCHMDYFIDVLTTFLCVDRVRILAVYGRVRELSEFIKNILICVPKMNESLIVLERHEGE